MKFVPELLNREVKHRSEQIKVNELKIFYEVQTDEDLFIECRGIGLGGLMSAKSEASQSFQLAIEAVQKALASQETTELGQAISDMRHLSREARYQFYIVVAGTDLDESDVSHLAEFYPQIVLRLSSKIQDLTGAGPESKKKSSSDGTVTQI